MAKKPRATSRVHSSNSRPTAAVLPASVGAMQAYPQTLRRQPIPEHHVIAWRRIINWTFLLIVTAFILAAGWVGWKFYQNAAKLTGDNNPLHLFSLFFPQPLKGEDQGRVNILVAGNSADDPGHAGAQLTDSIMILSIDTRNHTAFMLSIPRDTWVNLPDMGYAKINAANEVTSFQEAGLPGGGMGELEFVIERDLGIPIDYYALVNYSAFRDAVNAVGGIDINIQSPDPRGLYDPSIDYATNGPLVDLSNGVHHLNGEQALDLARARGDAYGSYGFPQADISREGYQRQMALTIRDKALSAGVVSNPIKLGQLADAFGNNVKTDINLNNIERLYSLTKNLNDSNIQSMSLDKINNQQLLTGYITSDGQDALIPTAGVGNFSQIQTAIQQLLAVNQQ